MIIKNLVYKNTAIEELLAKANKLLIYDKNDTIIFKHLQAQVKTIIIADFSLAIC